MRHVINRMRGLKKIIIPPFFARKSINGYIAKLGNEGRAVNTAGQCHWRNPGVGVGSERSYEGVLKISS